MKDKIERVVGDKIERLKLNDDVLERVGNGTKNGRENPGKQGRSYGKYYKFKNTRRQTLKSLKREPPRKKRKNMSFDRKNGSIGDVPCKYFLMNRCYNSNCQFDHGNIFPIHFFRKELRLRSDRWIKFDRKSPERVEVKKITIYDFDDTLFATWKPEEGKVHFKEKTGKNWSGGWWGNYRTLKEPFTIDVGPAFYSAKYDLQNTEGKLVVVLTGRHSELLQQVTKITKEHLPSPHRFICKPNQWEYESVYYKIAVIYDLILEHLKRDLELVIYEDRIKDVRIFLDLMSQFMKDGIWLKSWDVRFVIYPYKFQDFQDVSITCQS